MADYPNCCLRGISQLSDITQDGRVGATAFYPDERTLQFRTDNRLETSINWDDDENALPFTIEMFHNGVVRLERKEIDRINSLPASSNDITYERSPEVENSYHGNILFNNNLSKQVRKMIAGTLALSCSRVILENDS